jgi:tetratricopeptide (TPR) repeat protein
MVSYLLGTEKIETNLEELILGKTEGVPFFIEELIKSLRDLKIIEKRNNSFNLVKDIQGVVIPSTIQDTIMARVDSLPESAKEVLQAGSVIEREFSYDLIKLVTDLRERELLSHLSVLKDSELLYERGVYPNSAYIFKHMLTREVVYESMLTKRKRIFHEKIGNSIEVLYRENIDNNCAILAEHYSISENYDKAARYSKLAYKQAVKKASFNNAIAYARKEIACLERLPQTNDVQKKIVDARTALALYYVQMDFYVEAKETVKPIVEFALKQNYERRISQIYTVLGAYSFEVEEDFPKSLKYLEDALKISKELSDNLSLVMARIFLATALSRNCRFKIALNHYQKVLQVNEAASNLWGISTIKSLIAVRVLHYQGNIDLGYRTSEEAVSMAEQGGDILSKAMAYASHGCSWYYKGKLENAKEYLLRGVDLCQKINYFAWTAFANWFLGETFFEEGDYQKSQLFYNKTISLIENSRLSPSFSNLNKVALTRAKVINDEKVIELERLYRYEADNKIEIYEGQISKYISEIFLKIDDQNLLETEKWIRQAIEADKRHGMMWNLGRNYALYAEFFKRKGNNTRAKENLRKAIEILNECGADGWVSKYKEKMVLYS